MTTDLGVPAPVGPHLDRTRRRAGAWSLPEVRWAVAATALFLLGLAAQLTGAPEPLWWALYLA
ncbi:hypothetical protein ACFV4N_36440, partial [Actinosynnema sp. NPDC059797]